MPPNANEDLYAKLRQECHHYSYDCSAMRFIFESRATKLRNKVTWLKALGIIVPALVGSTALGYPLDSVFLKNLILFAIPVTIFQFVLSVWATIAKWEEGLAYSYEAVQSYSTLFTKFHDLANYPPSQFSSLKKQFDGIVTESSLRSQQDASHNVKEWEKRMGMRFSLRLHQCKCVGCEVKPLSLDSTNCDICGKFSLKYQYKLFTILNL